MAKFMTSAITRNILHLTIVTFLDVMVKINFPLLSAHWYVFRMETASRYLTRGSNENALYTIGWERLIRRHSSARFCFELSRNSN